jgi:hypothetical protein
MQRNRAEAPVWSGAGKAVTRTLAGGAVSGGDPQDLRNVEVGGSNPLTSTRRALMIDVRTLLTTHRQESSSMPITSTESSATRSPYTATERTSRPVATSTQVSCLELLDSAPGPAQLRPTSDHPWLRDLTRYRKTQVDMRSAESQRLEVGMGRTGREACRSGLRRPGIDDAPQRWCPGHLGKGHPVASFAFIIDTPTVARSPRVHRVTVIVSEPMARCFG